MAYGNLGRPVQTFGSPFVIHHDGGVVIHNIRQTDVDLLRISVV